LKHQGKDENIDEEVVQHFGKEWAKYSYLDGLASEALDAQFLSYTNLIDFGLFNKTSATAADFGAGSGRWTERIKQYFKVTYALEPSAEAADVLNLKFHQDDKVKVVNESIQENSIQDSTLDFAMSLGVLHHIPDTQKAMLDIARKLKPGGTFLCYLYYKVEDKPFAYRVIFHLTDFIRMVISRLPHFLRMSIAKIIAAVIYLPLARYAAMHMKWGKDVSNIPLHHYAKMPFIMLENDALDRFGTRLEQRFNKDEITSMLSKSGFDLNTLKFSEVEPYWTFLISLK
jgi:SAM-dependent methyltransferase